jgi:hypothetical protein
MKRHRWTWVACSMLAVYLASMVAAISLSVVNAPSDRTPPARSGWR